MTLSVIGLLSSNKIIELQSLISLPTPVIVADRKADENCPRRHVNIHCTQYFCLQRPPEIRQSLSLSTVLYMPPIVYKFNHRKSALISPPKMIIMKLAPPSSANLLTEEFGS